ncbi:MAG TPA: hypothetical protein VKB27_22225 [Gammaproteobacteria bacterium]|nr:hypothetical protein [Gammaproteobacteria bacterium]
MTPFEEIKISGVDEARPPKIRKEAYIDLHFRLSRQVPEDWCEDFNVFGRRINPAAKIDKSSRLNIDTYVNDMDRIPLQLAELKEAVSECNKQYLEKLRQREAALIAENAALQGEGGEQQRLNLIVDGLEFDE